MRRNFAHHEKARLVKRGATSSWVIKLLKTTQIKTYFERWKQNHQVMIGATAQVGNFVSMVINGKWWKIKKRYLIVIGQER